MSLKKARQLLLGAFIAGYCATGIADARVPVAIERLNCRGLTAVINTQLPDFDSIMSSSTLRLAEFVGRRKGGGLAFDFLDVSLENILAMQDMSSRLGGASFYLELPNQCDTREERGIMSLNLTHFDLCYVAAPKYILEFSPTTSSELILAEAGLLEGSYFGGVGVADGSGPEFHTRTLNNLNQTLQTVFAETGAVYDLSLIELQAGDEVQRFLPFYLERDILIDDDYLVTRLRFIDMYRDSVILEFNNVFYRDSGEPVCEAEIERAFPEGSFEHFLVTELALQTN